jgi:nicotinate-nucleotide adenylyltransferase
VTAGSGGPVIVVPRRRVLGAASPSVDPSVEPEAEDESAAEGVPRRLGIFGGTFDPPHHGHLWLATLATDEMSLDRVLFVPAAQPPHKPGRPIASPTDRLVMTRLAIADEPSFELSPLEMERTGPSYTIDSVEELQRVYPDASLFLIMAADSLSQIDTWREPDRLLSLIEWVVGPRPGSPGPRPEALRERFGPASERIHLLNGPSLDVSSSEIRRRVATGHAIRYLVPRAVHDFIVDRGLYRGGEAA